MSDLRLELSSRFYSKSALEEAARAFSPACEIRVSERKGGFAAVLSPGKGGAAKPLEIAAGEFLNEALNQERRKDVLRARRAAVHWIATRALFSALQPPEQEARSAAVSKTLDEAARALAKEIGGSIE
jgi:hypothetical protein